MPPIRTAADGYARLHGRPDSGARSVIDLLRSRGTPVPEPSPGPPVGPPVEARVNHGRWISDCDLVVPSGHLRAGERCRNAQYVHPDDPRFFCVSCHNAAVDGCWRPVRWPPDRAAVEAALERLPVREQNWPPETRAIGELHPAESEPAEPEGA